MKTPPPSALIPATPRQLAIPFETARLGGMTAAERRMSLARLASLLLQAAGIAAEERDDDEH